MRFRDFHINIKIRIIETFLSRTVSGMVFPFMTIYLAAHFSAKLTGILLLINVMVGAVANFIGGYYADLVGRKKLLVTAESLRFIAFVVMTLSNSPWFELPLLTYFMMVMNTICWGLSAPAGQAMLIDVSTPEQRKYMFSLSYWAINFSIAIGSILGGFFFKSYFFELLIIMTATSLIVLLMLVLFIKESLVRQAVEDSSHSVKGLFSAYKRVIGDRLFMVFFLASTLILTMEMHLTNYIGIHLSQDMPKQMFLSRMIDGINALGILKTENTLLVVLISVLVVKIISRFKDRNALLFGLVLYVVGYSLLSYTTNIWLLLILMIVATIGEVVRVPIEESYMAIIPPEDARSAYMAVNGLAYNVGSIVISLFVTMSAYLPPFWMSVAIFFVGTIGFGFFVMILPKLDERKQEAEQAYQTVS
ncbi:MDR family MFS transporter [Tuberibacillus calidus]|jgi:DHA1 family multidrug resistance protein B-like MFS transporter|uniref:MDR family MFS transporter n=1 Tax=Tuberibacillus calidus TaxID=340097 RepID=UPI0003FA414B|nr:MFS transporter [Tuberibacillus calidus]